MIRLLVCGSRTLQDKQNYIFKTLDNLVGSNHIEVVISGLAKGPDLFALYWANGKGIKVLEFPADWDKYKRAAGPIRNKQMLDEGKPTHVICIMDCRQNPDGTNGSKHMVKIAKEKGIPVKIIYVKE